MAAIPVINIQNEKPAGYWTLLKGSKTEWRPGKLTTPLSLARFFATDSSEVSFRKEFLDAILSCILQSISSSRQNHPQEKMCTYTTMSVYPLFYARQIHVWY